MTEAWIERERDEHYQRILDNRFKCKCTPKCAGKLLLAPFLWLFYPSIKLAESNWQETRAAPRGFRICSLVMHFIGGIVFLPFWLAFSVVYLLWKIIVSILYVTSGACYKHFNEWMNPDKDRDLADYDRLANHNRRTVKKNKEAAFSRVRKLKAKHEAGDFAKILRRKQLKKLRKKEKKARKKHGKKKHKSFV